MQLGQYCDTGDEMGLLNNVLDSIRYREYEEDYEEDYEEEPRPAFFWKQKDAAEDMGFKISMFRPATIEDVKEICDSLLDGNAVVVSLENMKQGEESRIVDFLSGAIYSLNGNIQRISDYVYVGSPEEVVLS